MKKEKMGFEEAARFNKAMDTNRQLSDGMLKLIQRYGSLTEQEYTGEMLALFREAGLDLTAEELYTLLKLRIKTDQMLLDRKAPAEGGQNG